MSSAATNDQSRERLIALVLLLQSVFPDSSLSQEEIVRNLQIDAYPESAKGPQKVRAYQGADSAVRQKFERDKARIRDLGFEIETVALSDGAVGYRIDPASGYAPSIDFTPEEERVVQLALRFCGFGASGVFSLFNEGPASDGGLEFTNYYTPILRALHLRRAVSFDYHSSTNKNRMVEPLTVGVFNGAAYLVARVSGTNEVKGYRFSRMTSMPLVLSETFDADEAVAELAKAWRPEFSRSPTPVDVVVTTNQNYADLLVRQFPGSVAAQKRGGAVEIGISFDSSRGALRFVLEAADRVRLMSPKSLKVELADWLANVNRGKVPALERVSFVGAAANDVLGQTLQLLHAVYRSEDGLRISELAERFSLDPALVRRTMDRLVSFMPMQGEYGYPAHVIKECDDWENEADDDSTYRAEEFDWTGTVQNSPLLWRDLFELNIALREASRVYPEPALDSAIEKIEAATKAFVQVESSTAEPLLGIVRDALENEEQIKIEYTSTLADHSQVRTIEPREIKVLNGHAYVRAWCTSREAWRTFRVDRINAVLAKSPAEEPRPADDVTNWLTQVGEEGDEVIVVVDANLRWLFEPLPNAQWTTLSNRRHAVKFRVSEGPFLDHLLLQAGPGAVVATPKYAKAGHDLARRIAAQL
jgi:predicted DNA-binding transcriptional regulator YafY